MQFLYSIPNYALLSIIAIIIISFSFIVLFFVNQCIPIYLRKQHNDVTAPLAGTTGVLYAVLVGLIAVSVLTNFDRARESIKNEADIVATLYHQANNLSAPTRNNIQALTKLYLETTINKEWPYMRQGLPIPHNDIIGRLNLLITHYKNQSLRESLAVDNLNKSVDALYAAHKDRENWNLSSIHPDVWIVIIMGTILIIGVHLLLGINLRIHLISIIALDMMAASLLFLVIAVDRPFMGKTAIRSEPFQILLERINARSGLL